MNCLSHIWLLDRPGFTTEMKVGLALESLQDDYQQFKSRIFPNPDQGHQQWLH